MSGPDDPQDPSLVPPPLPQPGPAAASHRPPDATEAADPGRGPFGDAAGPAALDAEAQAEAASNMALAGPPADEISEDIRVRLRQLGLGALLLGLGVLAGLWLAPDTPSTTHAQMAALQSAVSRRDTRIGELEAQAQSATGRPGGHLLPADRARHVKQGRAYVAALRRTGAQGAANLVQWFIGRWNQLLDSPQPDDRTSRRAEALALLVGGMASNLNPGDYVPWQAEFLHNDWMGELHFDIDGDGLPGPRSSQNTHDGFANVSVCQVAMALNQAMTDAQVLMMPEMRCDRPDSRMSVFLQGETFDDALNEFVRAVREQGFLVVEKREGPQRLVLVGNKPPRRDADADG